MQSPRFLLAILATLCALILMPGCQKDSHRMRKGEVGAISEANGNNKVIAEAVRPAAPKHAALLDAQASKIDAAMTDVPAEMKAPPTITLEQLDQRIDEAVAGEQARVVELEAALRQEREKPWYQKVVSWSGWVVVGAGTIWLMKALGVPGAQLLAEPLVRAIAGRQLKAAEAQAATFAQRASTALAAVESSDVARAGLALLDRKLGLGDKISKATGGKATSIEGLWKMLAKDHAIDIRQQGAIAAILSEVRDGMDTDGGVEGVALKRLPELTASAN
jgi:hypothetical protein